MGDVVVPPKTYTRRPVASARLHRQSDEPRFPRLDQSVPCVIVELGPDGRPDSALLIFPTARAAEAHAQAYRLADYRVVPAVFARLRPPRLEA
ncbi:hypothetical protein [Frankia sp. Cj5]|uniref:hypothetical protein n=1 Tax=Frankia sp. Cj5 TaxID=2880978 RepID=UPI001EF61FF7|nr:hypothetical protein [Frankia sp. Cj5]